MSLAASPLTRIAAWLSAIVCYDSMLKRWKPLSNPPIEYPMKGLEALQNDGHLNEDEAGQHAEQLHQDLALLQHQQRNPIDPKAVSLEWCEACGMEIPELRRQALPGVSVCVDCAREAERKEKLGR